MPTTIAIESKPVLGSFEHLYLVKTVTTASGRVIEELVIRGGPVARLRLDADADLPLAASDDARGFATPRQRHQTELDLGGRDPEAVWYLMVQHARNIDAARLSYGEANSNTVVGSVLHAVGLSLSKSLPSGIEFGEVPGYTRLSAMRVDDRLTGGSDADKVFGGVGHDYIRGNAGNDGLWGESGNDIAYGGLGADRLYGDIGNDRLHGESGNDALRGGSGDDYLRGGAGRDLLAGGADDDLFVFAARSESGATSATRDVITDFRHEDTIDLSAIDANLGVAGNQRFTFVAEFTGTAGQLEWDPISAGYVVSADLDGDGTADFSVQVNSTEARILASDFVL